MFATLSLLVASSIALAQCDIPRFGVGFNLNLDYGVASVHFANGTSIGVAKIEGTVQYKEIMRAYSGSNGHELHEDTSSIPPSLKPRLLRHRLSPWLGGRALDPRAQALLPMLRTLKVATEALVDCKIEDVTVAFPYQTSGILFAAAKQAGAELSLDVPFQSKAAHMAAYANGIGREDWGGYACSANTRWILTVDYSRAAFTATLSTEDCGVFEEMSVTHNTTYPALDLDASVLATVLHVATGVPDIAGFQLCDRIDILILAGERGDDPTLRRALNIVLAASAYDGIDLASVWRENMVDPLYAAAIGAAVMSLQKKGPQFQCDGQYEHREL